MIGERALNWIKRATTGCWRMLRKFFPGKDRLFTAKGATTVSTESELAQVIVRSPAREPEPPIDAALQAILDESRAKFERGDHLNALKSAAAAGAVFTCKVDEQRGAATTEHLVIVQPREVQS